MKATIFTMGTRGDVQPYVFLAQELQKSAFTVTIGTHPCWEELVKNAEIEFVPIGPNVDMEYEAAVIRGRTKSPILSMMKTMKFVFKIIQNSSDDIYKACKGQDLIIVSHSHMGAAEAEACHIKTVDVTLQTQTIPEVGKPVSFINRMLGGLITAQMVKPFNKIRKQYQLPKLKSMDECMSPYLNLIPISAYTIKRNPYWAEKNKLVGYWYQEDLMYQPDETLLSFLQQGEKPVILALGAMSFESEQEKEKLDIFVHAFQKTGMRAIIQGFHKTLVDYELPAGMISVGSIPHNWLFRQGFCVIHHCGFGTAAASVVYGIPSIPLPHVLDQFGIAQELVDLGVACEPVKALDLSEEKMIAAILAVKADYEGLSERVLALSKKMQEEKGLETAVKLIKEVCETY